MTIPATVEIAFGIEPFDDTSLGNNANWVDVTGYVRSVDYTTSTRSDRFGVFVGGNATIVLNALDRVMDPSYASSTYVGEFKSRTPVRISGTHSSTDYVQWYGYADLWQPGYDGADAVTVLTAYDVLTALGTFDLAELSSASYAGETIGERLDRVCDLWGLPSNQRDFEAGAGLTDTLFAVNALFHCQQAAMSDGGFLYAQRDGVLTFEGMYALTTARQQTSQATLTGHLVDPPPQRAGVGKSFRNLVRIGGPGVTAQTTDNVPVNGLPVAYQRLDLLMQFDAKAASLADFYAELYSTETPFTSSATFTAATAAQPTYGSSLFVRKLRDRVTISINPPGPGGDITDQVFIDGMTGRISPDRWDITYTFSSADAYDDNLLSQPSTWYIVGTSLIGTGRVGY